MPLLKVLDPDGVEHVLQADAGGSVMEPLRDNDLGVTAICGGMCACATCHVYIDPEWIPRLPAPMSDEIDMLKDLGSYQAGGSSRLSCQIRLTAALDGLKLTVAPQE